MTSAAPTPAREPDSRLLRPIDPRVRAALCALGRRFADKGVRLFLFGSVARSWPLAPVGADFDLGYEIAATVPGQNQLRRELDQEVEALPSIRPVDLVDFARAPAEFRAVAAQCLLDLTHASTLPAAS